jgi:hypothetical protein
MDRGKWEIRGEVRSPYSFRQRLHQVEERRLGFEEM